MATTSKLGLAVSSNPNDSVYEYWNKMLNVTNGNFVLIDNEFIKLATQVSFTIPSTAWVTDVQGPFTKKAEIVLQNTGIQDNSTVEAYFEDIIHSAGVVLYSATPTGYQNRDTTLVFYADTAKDVDIDGVLKYVY